MLPALAHYLWLRPIKDVHIKKYTIEASGAGCGGQWCHGWSPLTSNWVLLQLWRKVLQMSPVSIYFLWIKQLEDADDQMYHRYKWSSLWWSMLSCLISFDLQPSITGTDTVEKSPANVKCQYAYFSSNLKMQMVEHIIDGSRPVSGRWSMLSRLISFDLQLSIAGLSLGNQVSVAIAIYIIVFLCYPHVPEHPML